MVVLVAIVIAIFSQERQFSRCIATEQYHFFQDQVFVMWNWQWLEDSDSEHDGVVSGDEPGDAAPSNSEESGMKKRQRMIAFQPQSHCWLQMHWMYKRGALPGIACTG